MSGWFRERRPNARQRESRLWSFGEQPPPRRERVVYMAILYTALAAICLVAVLTAVSQILAGDSGFIVMLFIFGVPGVILASFARQYLRDLRANCINVEGDVVKKWHKGNLFIFLLPSYYIYVEDKVFAISRREYAMLLEGDRVRVTCFPHSLTVERLERFDESAKQYVPAASGALS